MSYTIRCGCCLYKKVHIQATAFHHPPFTIMPGTIPGSESVTGGFEYFIFDAIAKQLKYFMLLFIFYQQRGSNVLSGSDMKFHNQSCAASGGIQWRMAKTLLVLLAICLMNILILGGPIYSFPWRGLNSLTTLIPTCSTMVDLWYILVEL